jgi:hypothetical protein
VPTRARCVSIFLDKNRRHIGKSQPKRPPQRTQRTPHQRLQEPQALQLPAVALRHHVLPQQLPQQLLGLCSEGGHTRGLRRLRRRRRRLNAPGLLLRRCRDTRSLLLRRDTCSLLLRGDTRSLLLRRDTCSLLLYREGADRKQRPA